jgi:hypothetical protein
VRKAFLAAALLALAAVPARAEIQVADSLEWMTVASPVVLRGKVIGHRDVKGPGSVVYRDFTIRIEEAVKGRPAGKELVVRFRLFAPDPAGLAWQADGRSLLFFLTEGRAADDKELAGKLVPRDGLRSVIDLERPTGAFTADMQLATTELAVLSVVRRYAGWPAARGAGRPNVFTGQRGFLRLEVPFEAPIHGKLFGGSTCYLIVPALEKYRPMAERMARARSPHTRAQGADMLQNYPGLGTVRLLTKLLADPGEQRWRNQRGEVVSIEYPVRRAAYDSLVALGEKPKRPVVERKPKE